MALIKFNKINKFKASKGCIQTVKFQSFILSLYQIPSLKVFFNLGKGTLREELGRKGMERKRSRPFKALVDEIFVSFGGKHYNG